MSSDLGVPFSPRLRRHQRLSLSKAKSSEKRSRQQRERSGCSATRVEDWRRAELGQNRCSHRRQHHARSQFIADKLLNKTDVIRAMHERVQLCQDPQTEFSFLRECLGVSRINHILPVHGHAILEEQSAAAVDDEIGQRSVERLFPVSRRTA